VIQYTNLPDWYGSETIFCEQRSCVFKYQEYVRGRPTLQFGVPHLWSMDTNLNPLYCQVPKRVMNKNGDDLPDLTCDFCGVKHFSVVSHPRVPVKYGHTNFCQNDYCYAGFRYYADVGTKIPYSISQQQQENRRRQQEQQREWENQNEQQKKTMRKMNNQIHDHILTFSLPLEYSADEDTNKDPWCPKKHDLLTRFRNVLLEAFMDYILDDKTVREQLERVRCKSE